VRILFVSNMWPPVVVGGAERYAVGLAESLRGRGHEVGVVTFGVPGDDVVGMVTDHRLKPGEDTPSWWQRKRFHLEDVWNVGARRVLRESVASFRPDVVHTHVTIGMSVAALLTDAPRVHTTHDLWLLCQGSQQFKDNEVCERTCAECIPYRVTRKLLVGRDRPVLVAPSEKTRDLHVERGWDRDWFRVIRYPAMVPDVDPPPRRAVGHPLRLGYIGQVAEHKGVLQLLEALERMDDTLLVCAGPGPLVPTVEADPRVEYRGIVGGEEKERFFADIDALVVPSRWHETAGLILDEAASRGVPVIAARRGGIPEYVAEPCLPLLFEPEDPSSLVASVERFRADPAAFPSAPPPVERTWDHHTDRILEAYEDARRLSA
jgi:glycosyltransferase involved in cell wall biosynthesis